MYDFSDKTVVITGASGGIGRAAAQHFAACEAFLLLHTCQNSSQVEGDLARIRKKGGDGIILQADFSQPDDRKKFFASVLEHSSKIDIWINAAGIDLMAPASKAMSWEKKIRQLFEVDVFATMELSREIGFRMKEQGGGTIFFFGWDGVEYGWPGETAELYGAAKGALAGFSRCLAESLAPSVRIRHLALGWIKTHWGQRASEEYDRRVSMDSLRERWGNPEDVAETLLFLAADASDYIDGINIRLNGGKRGNK